MFVDINLRRCEKTMGHFCFATYEIFPFTRGGAGTYITSTALQLTRQGHEVSLLLDVDEDTFNQCTASVSRNSVTGCLLRLHRVTALVGECEYNRSHFSSEALWKSYQFALSARALHAEIPIDVLEYVDYCGPAYFAQLFRAMDPSSMPKAIVVRMHNTIELIDKFSGSVFRKERIYDYWLERTAINLAEQLLSPGLRYWRELASPLYNIPETKVTISPPCRTPLPYLNDGDSGANVVFVGRISLIKGMDLFLQAMSSLCNDPILASSFSKIRIIGPTESVATQDEERILSWGKSIPTSRIQFLGNLSEADISAELADARVAVFPNKCESYCYAAHEAHLIGAPIILSDIPAFRDHFEDGDSAIFFDGSAADLTVALRKVLTDPALRKRLSSSVLNHRERYNIVTYGSDLDQRTGLAKGDGKPEQAGASKSRDKPKLETPVTVLHFLWPSDSRGLELYHGAPPGDPRSIEYVEFVPTEPTQGTLSAFGHHWKIRDGSTAHKHLVSAGYIFLSFSNCYVAPSFLERAICLLDRLPSAGAVLPITIGSKGKAAVFGGILDLFIVRPDRPVHISPLLIRLAESLPIDQLFEDTTAFTTLTLLLALRAKGMAILEDLFPSTCQVGSEALSIFPTHSETAAFVKRNIRLFRDYELASSLVDEIGAFPLVSSPTPPTVAAMVEDDLYKGERDFLYIRCIDGIFPILSIFDLQNSHQIDWTSLSILGPYEILKTRDRTLGVLELSPGAVLRVDGSLKIALNVSVGPTCGTAAFTLNHRCALATAKHDHFSTKVLNPLDLFELTDLDQFQIPARGYHLSSYRPRRRFFARDAHDFNDPSATEMIVFARKEADAKVAKLLVGPCSTIIFPDLQMPEKVTTDLIASHIFAAGTKTAVFYGVGWRKVVSSFLIDYPKASATVILPTKATWSPTRGLDLLDMGNLERRFLGRARICQPLEASLRFGQECSVETYRPYIAFSRKTRDSQSHGRGIRIVIDRNPAGFEYMGHCAAVARLLCSRIQGVSGIFVPEQQAAQDILLETFGLAHLINHYKTFEQTLSSAGVSTIYLNPFPFGENFTNVLRAIQERWLLAISPYEFKLLGEPESLRSCVTHYWEDVEVVANTILASAQFH